MHTQGKKKLSRDHHLIKKIDLRVESGMRDRLIFIIVAYFRLNPG